MAPYRLPDGTPVFHPIGELLVDRDEDKVCCGLCGEWLYGLATHVRLAHDWSADEYRAEFGLKVQRPLQAPGVSEVQAARFKRRLKTDRGLQAAMRQGQAVARSGELNELGRQADAQRGRALERRRLTEQQGRRIGQLRVERFRARRDQRAQELGFADAEALLRQRYVVEEAPVSELANAFGCAAITVTSEIDRLGIPRRPPQERLALGREALARQRRASRARSEARAREVGFRDLGDYLDDRVRNRRWRQRDIADELGRPVGSVRALMREHGILPASAAAPTNEADPDVFQRWRLAAAHRKLASRRRARDDAIAERLGFASVEAWYAARRAAGATARQMMAEAGMGEKWLRRLGRDWRAQQLPNSVDRSRAHSGRDAPRGGHGASTTRVPGLRLTGLSSSAAAAQQSPQSGLERRALTNLCLTASARRIK